MTSARSDARASAAPVSSAPPAAPVSFRVEVHREGRMCRVAVIGEMDLSNVGLVDVNLSELTRRQPEALVLDLRQLTFLDSSGLRLVLGWAERAKIEGFSLRVIQGEPAIRRVFEITGTLDHVTYVAPDTFNAADRPDAVAATSEGRLAQVGDGS
jgi:anti-anti-sigma factor